MVSAASVHVRSNEAAPAFGLQVQCHETVYTVIIADARQPYPIPDLSACRRYGGLGHLLVVTTTIARFNHRVFSRGERHRKRPPRLA